MWLILVSRGEGRKKTKMITKVLAGVGGGLNEIGNKRITGHGDEVVRVV